MIMIMMIMMVTRVIMCDGDTDLTLAGGQTLGEVLLLPAEEALLLLGHHLDLSDLAPPGPGLGA